LVDESERGSVFLIFALPELDKLLTGRTSGAILQVMLGVPRSTADRLTSPSRYLDLMQRIASSEDESVRQLAEDLQSGVFPFHSRVSGFLYPSIRDVWQDYERSFRLFQAAEKFEVGARAKFGRLEANDLIRMIHGLELSNEVGNVFPDPDSSNFPMPELFESALRDDRSRVVRESFFEPMAVLDIDLYSSLFGSYMPRMIFPSVMPELVAESFKPYVDRPLRRLLDIGYCSVMDCDAAPSLEEMIASHDVELWESVRGKLERGTITLDVIQNLMSVWLESRPELKSRFEINGDSQSQRRYGMLLVLYFAARMFDFVFGPVRGRSDCPDLVSSFGQQYYAVWQRELARRGLSEAVGKPWDDSPVTRIIGGSYIFAE
jgi:hypothetical protein